MRARTWYRRCLSCNRSAIGAACALLCAQSPFQRQFTPCVQEWLCLHRLDRLVTGVMAAAEAVVDAGVTRCGRAYIAAAAILISLVAAVFFVAIVPEVGRAFHPGAGSAAERLDCMCFVSCSAVLSQTHYNLSRQPSNFLKDELLHAQLALSKGRAHAAGHAAFGLLLLANVAFNYAACVRTPPGTTADLAFQVRGTQFSRHCCIEVRILTLDTACVRVLPSTCGLPLQGGAQRIAMLSHLGGFRQHTTLLVMLTHWPGGNTGLLPNLITTVCSSGQLVWFADANCLKLGFASLAFGCRRC